ncbi:MAG: hypothetical protein ACLR5G_05865 [Eubacteriales bacterium]
MRGICGFTEVYARGPIQTSIKMIRDRVGENGRSSFSFPAASTPWSPPGAREGAQTGSGLRNSHRSRHDEKE